MREPQWFEIACILVFWFLALGIFALPAVLLCWWLFRSDKELPPLREREQPSGFEVISKTFENLRDDLTPPGA